MHTFYYHEDDPGQYTLKPIQWWEYYEHQFNALADHSAEHFDPDSYSWDQIYTPAEPDPELPTIDMSEQRFIELLTPFGKKFDRIDHNLSDYITLDFRSVGFGPSKYTGVIADLNDDRVGSLWCMPSGSGDSEKRMMGDLLQAAATDQHLLLADWRAEELVDLRDRDALNTYLGCRP